MGEPKTPYFYDFGILEWAFSSPNQAFLFLETPGDLKHKQKNPWNILHELYKSHTFGTHTHVNVGKGGRRIMMKIPVKQS